MIKYIGKSLLIEHRGARVLVVSDLHLGYNEVLRRGGVLLPGNIYASIKKDLEEIFTAIGRVDRVVLLGDLKHEFGMILREEREEIANLITYLRTQCGAITIIKGNHDVLLSYLAENAFVSVCDYFLWEGFCFVHGDKDFPFLYDSAVTHWIVGHAHPAISLQEGSKIEKYKCFLAGTYKRKNIIIVPSFFSVNEGTDPREFDLGLAWKFALNQFSVYIVGEHLEVLSFGKLSQIN